VGRRAGAYMVDLIPAMLISFGLGWLPLAGTAPAGIVLLAWWLLRDIRGASLGKMVLGLEVAGRDGAATSPRQRILRNITLIGAPLSMLLPISGWIALALTIVEVAMLLFRKERIGDLLAHTIVVHR